MEFSQAIRALAGNPHLVALRRGGPVLTMTARNQVTDNRNGNPRPYVGKFSDYVGTDWEVMTGVQLRELMESIAKARKAG